MNYFWIRPYTQEDQESILAVARSLALWFRPLDQMALAIDLQHHEGLVAQTEAGVIAFLIYHIPSPDFAELSWLGVHVDHQRQGLGAALLGTLERDLRQRNIHRVRVSTLDSTSPEPAFETVRRFYFDQGFLPLQRDENFFAAGRHRLLLEKVLD